jgi:hypothetical protein
MYLLTDIMDLVWMTQNLHAVISLVFGPQSHSASFLHSWAMHMYDNRLLFSSLYGSDSAFLFMYYLILIVHFKSTGVLVATMIVGCQSTFYTRTTGHVASSQFRATMTKIHH